MVSHKEAVHSAYPAFSDSAIRALPASEATLPENSMSDCSPGETGEGCRAEKLVARHLDAEAGCLFWGT